MGEKIENVHNLEILGVIYGVDSSVHISKSSEKCWSLLQLEIGWYGIPRMCLCKVVMWKFVYVEGFVPTSSVVWTGMRTFIS